MELFNQMMSIKWKKWDCNLDTLTDDMIEDLRYLVGGVFEVDDTGVLYHVPAVGYSEYKAAAALLAEYYSSLE